METWKDYNMTQMNCNDCSAPIPEGAKFCPECGAPARTDGSGTKSAKKKSNALRDNLIVIVVIAVIGVGYVIIREPEKPPVPVQQADEQLTNPHGGDMESMMGALPNIPSDFEGLVSTGNGYMDQGNYAVAAECYKRALVLKVDAFDVRTDFGACLHSMGLENRALEEFHKVINEHPEHAIANFNLGIVYYGMEKNDSAKYYWDRYLKIDPNGSAAEAARNYLKKIEG